MGFDKWFGFDLEQRKTLEKQLAELEAVIVALAARVKALEDAAP